MSKKGEMIFEAKEAKKQRKRRLAIDPLLRKDQWWLWRINLIGNWLAFEKSDRVLDVGAASCEVSEFVAAQGCEVVALDLSKGMLAISRDRLKKSLRIIDLHRIVADSETMPFRKNSFNKCLCWGVLHHLTDPKTALHEIYRSLKGGGTLMVSEPNRLNLFRRIGELGWQEINIESSFYPKEIRKLLLRIGYSINKMEYIYHRGLQKKYRLSQTARKKTSILQRTQRLQRIIGHHLSQKLGIIFKYFFGEIFIKSQKPTK